MVAVRGAAARRGALLLLLAALGACRLRLARAAASCPRSLDCALQRREFCPPGSGTCGPCLPPFREDNRGRCIQKQLSPSGRTSIPSLDEKIDFLVDVLARQEAPHSHSLQDGKPRTTLVPASGRQRMASRLREGLLQREAATTLPTSTTTAVQKYPVEVSPIPSNDDMVLGLIMVCTVAGLSALIVAAVCWCRLQKEVRLAQKADYSAQRAASPLPYDKISVRHHIPPGVFGAQARHVLCLRGFQYSGEHPPARLEASGAQSQCLSLLSPQPGDKTLAQSAQMYHYQHQKQQMLSMEKHKEEPKLPDSASSDEENEDGDFTVYECPGLAPTGEMEVRNPLFDDSSLHPSNPKSHQ
ncbi:LOW QUALITY PROTEIN: neural proliferation differentiation and control protein 1 [Aquila chrysaetos chrysaetos]|uniref:LOW QUALITY PROTEIN: neural proliferation differentiation and control protein 1 n=1 Tax=Aquila chrysaetos chrysaetos TaxID=223781 RepID=UPI0011770989|nr:LOW QUALITY PROTEIN: neural proliferation differentiation and control protein 1 [Aquila chrysaetos chrysaetos]